MLLKGKTAVVYGAAGAVGSAVARLFAREGATVVLAGRSSTPLAVLAANIERAGGTASDLPVDALDGDAMDQHADAIVEQTGRLDVSLNAIAVDHLQGVPLTELPEQDVVGQVVDRVRTHLLTARAAARHMTTQGRGVILTFTADAARLADPNIGGFGVACAAVEGLTRALAAELGPDGRARRLSALDGLPGSVRRRRRLEETLRRRHGRWHDRRRAGHARGGGCWAAWRRLPRSATSPP